MMTDLFEQFNHFLIKAPFPIIGVGSKGTIKSWNDQAATIFGWQKEEIIHHKVTKILAPSPTHKKSIETLNEALLAQEIEFQGQTFELIGMHRDGTTFPIKIFLIPLKAHKTFLRYMFVNDLRLQPQATPQLKQNETFFHVLVENIKDYAFYLLDPVGKIMSWNLGAERIKGYKAEEVIGQHFSLFYSKADLDVGKPQYELKVAIADGKYEEEEWRIRKDGSLFWAHVLITPIWGPLEELKGFAEITRDLTAQRLTEEALRQIQERYRLLVDSILDYAIFMLDPKGRVVSWNIGAERIKGYKAEEIIGEHFSCFYTKEDIQAGRPALGLKIAAEKGRFEDIGWRVKKDGTKFWAHVLINAIRDEQGHFTGFSKVTRDLTEHQKMSEAEKALKTRDEFLSIAAHELKTPLTTLKLQLQLAKEELKSELFMLSSAELLKIFDDCLKWVNSLTNLVNELLDVSRIRTGNFALKLEKINLSSLVKEIVDYYRPHLVAAKCPSVELDLDLTIMVYCDRNRIEQVIVNLLSNVIKHAPESFIYIVVKKKDENTAIFSVQDFGPGIAKKDQKKIFERFEQAIVSPSGLGLGLYITKGIIEAHQGKINVESEPGKGSIFIIELPIHPHMNHQ